MSFNSNSQKEFNDEDIRLMPIDETFPGKTELINTLQKVDVHELVDVLKEIDVFNTIRDMDPDNNHLNNTDIGNLNSSEYANPNIMNGQPYANMDSSGNAETVHHFDRLNLLLISNALIFITFLISLTVVQCFSIYATVRNR